jgi:ribosomal protein S18 acetylase RimI-like enzyme
MSTLTFLMIDCILRPAQWDDITLLSTLGRQSYTQHFGSIWSNEGLVQYLDDHFNISVLKQQISSGTVKYFVPYYKQIAAGILKVKLNSQLPAPPFDKGFELEKIYLLNEFTGKGIGAMVIQECEKLAINSSQRFIWLDVLKSNIRAHRKYEQLGFITVGDIPFSSDLERIDMWVMRKDL